MIDFHNHILPDLDDGSKSLEMSMDMLRTAADQGITDIINTVHFQHPKVDGIDISLERCSEKRELLYDEMAKEDLSIKIHLGAEVFYLPNLVDIINPLTTFGHGKYMLVEFLSHQIPDTQQQVLFDLKMKGVTPIIAHPERYKPVQENLSIIYKWINAGCLIQVDAGSLTGSLGTSAKTTAMEIVKRKLCQFIGSDVHDNHRRNFCLKEAIEICGDVSGDNVDEWVYKSPSKLLAGEPIEVMIEDEPQPKVNLLAKLFKKKGKIN